MTSEQEPVSDTYIEELNNDFQEIDRLHRLAEGNGREAVAALLKEHFQDHGRETVAALVGGGAISIVAIAAYVAHRRSKRA